MLLLSTFFFRGARGESASGGAKGNGGESALELGVKLLLLLSTFFFRGRGGESASSVWLAQRLTHVRKGFCQERILSRRNFVRRKQAGILSGKDFVRKGFCQEGILSGKDFVRKGFCQERILSGRIVVRKRALPGRIVVRKRALPGGAGGQSGGRGASQLWSWV